MSYLGILALLSLLIVLHELGHLIAARLTGIPVAGFSVGFGPKLWARRWGPVEYSLRAFPLGGFVMPAVTDEEFRAVPLRKRLAFFLGGPLANLLAPLPLLSILNGIRGGVSFDHLVILPFQQVAGFCWQLLGSLASLFSHPESLSGIVGIVVEGGASGSGGNGIGGRDLPEPLPGRVQPAAHPHAGRRPDYPRLPGASLPRFVRLRVPLTVLGMVLLAVLMIYSNGQDVVRYLKA